MSKDETCGMQKVTSAYNKLRAEEFSHLRGRFYARFPKSLASDYTLEQEIFLHFDVLQAENKQLKASHDKLVEALKKYGNHLRDCPYFHPIMPTEEIKCNCGLEQALKEAEK